MSELHSIHSEFEKLLNDKMYELTFVTRKIRKKDYKNYECEQVTFFSSCYGDLVKYMKKLRNLCTIKKFEHLTFLISIIGVFPVSWRTGIG